MLFGDDFRLGLAFVVFGSVKRGLLFRVFKRDIVYANCVHVSRPESAHRRYQG